MARRMTPSQIHSQMQQAQRRHRAVVQRINTKVRAYNSHVRRFNADRKRAINTYNRELRALNSESRANHARINSTLSRLKARSNLYLHVDIYQSAVRVFDAFQVIERSEIAPDIADLAEREAANSLSLANILLEEEGDTYFASQSLTETSVAGMLATFSAELSERWKGAIFALDARNPDASRHFCTSAREIIADVLNLEAPDDEVLAWFPNAELTPQGTPTRRQKFSYCLARRGMYNSNIENFGEANIKDISTLFKELNAGAHCPAGQFTIPQLTAIKTRVEDAIGFVCAVVSN